MELIEKQKALELIEKMPSVQFELLRCFDCIHMSKENVDTYWCTRLHTICYRVKPTDYCSKGVRRTDGVDS